MKTIPFTQYVRPNGRQEQVTIDLPDDCFTKYEELRAAGLRLTAEVLSTGHASFCIEDRELGDFAITLCPNGEKVPETIATMIRSFDRAAFDAWKKNHEEMEEAR